MGLLGGLGGRGAEVEFGAPTLPQPLEAGAADRGVEGKGHHNATSFDLKNNFLPKQVMHLNCEERGGISSCIPGCLTLCSGVVWGCILGCLGSHSMACWVTFWGALGGKKKWLKKRQKKRTVDEH